MQSAVPENLENRSNQSLPPMDDTLNSQMNTDRKAENQCNQRNQCTILGKGVTAYEQKLITDN